MIEREADVAIAGAGPAGAALAARLASQGVRVVACEKSSFPRDKLCGEFLSWDGVACLGRLGALDDVAARGAPIESLLVSSPATPRTLSRPLPSQALGITRRALDASLAAHAGRRGATILERCRVVHAEPGALDAELQGEPLRIRAAILVDATGRLGGVRAGDEAEAVTRPEHVGVQVHRRVREPWPRRVELHAFDGGYAGLNAVEDGLVTACAIVRGDRLREAGSAERLFELAAIDNPLLGERLAGLGPVAAEPQATARRVNVSPRRGPMIPMGDAAEMIAPACGDGMSMALRSAELLAPLLLRALRSGDAMRLRERWDAVRAREFGARLRWGRLVEAALMGRAHWAIRLGRALPSLADAAVRATRGDVSSTGLR